VLFGVLRRVKCVARLYKEEGLRREKEDGLEWVLLLLLPGRNSRERLQTPPWRRLEP
jgi:hypothetical protein